MITLLAVVAAFLVVLGMLSFLVYCNNAIDAEADKVARYRA